MSGAVPAIILVARIEDKVVRLSADADVAVMFEEESGEGL